MPGCLMKCIFSFNFPFHLQECNYLKLFGFFCLNISSMRVEDSSILFTTGDENRAVCPGVSLFLE